MKNASKLSMSVISSACLRSVWLAWWVSLVTPNCRMITARSAGLVTSSRLASVSLIRRKASSSSVVLAAPDLIHRKRRVPRRGLAAQDVVGGQAEVALLGDGLVGFGDGVADQPRARAGILRLFLFLVQGLALGEGEHEEVLIPLAQGGVLAHALFVRNLGHELAKALDVLGVVGQQLHLLGGAAGQLVLAALRALVLHELVALLVVGLFALFADHGDEF